MFIPILNGWQARNRVSRAVIQQRQAELDAQTLKVTLRQNIEQAYNNMLIAARRFIAFQTQVNALTTALRAAEIRLNAGASNQVDYTLAKQNLSVAQSNLVQSKYDYVFRTKVLDFYQNKPLTF
jgi:outer membrane protein